MQYPSAHPNVLLITSSILQTPRIEKSCMVSINTESIKPTKVTNQTFFFFITIPRRNPIGKKKKMFIMFSNIIVSDPIV